MICTTITIKHLDGMEHVRRIGVVACIAKLRYNAFPHARLEVLKSACSSHNEIDLNDACSIIQ